MNRVVITIASLFLVTTIALAAYFQSQHSPEDAVPASIDRLPSKPRLITAVTKLGQVRPVVPGGTPQAEYPFPQLQSSSAGVGLIIAGGAVPAVSQERVVTEGAGAIPRAGDKVDLIYDMFAWSTGELVDSTPNAPLTIWLGAEHPQVPDFLEQSVGNHPVGSRLLIVLGASAQDLPERLNSDDGYVIVVDVKPH